MNNAPNIPTRKLPPQPSYFSNLIQQALSLHKKGLFLDAQSIYQQILEVQPDHFGALQLLGVLLTQTNQHTQAIDFLSRALSINPNHAACYSNLSIALRQTNRLEESLMSSDKAISLNPEFAEAHYNRGSTLFALNSLNEAQVSYQKAINIKPDYAEAYYNLGVILYAQNRINEAIVSYQKAINLKPKYAAAYWNLSLCNLLNGNFNDGWKGFEWRWKNQEIRDLIRPKNLTQPLWLGTEPLKNKTILLFAEQGLGDTIQFSRYIPLVSRLGSKILLEVQRPLVNLFNKIEGVNEIYVQGDTLPEFDYQCPLLSLPLAFKTELNTIPPVTNSINSENNKVKKWQSILGKKSRLRVGVLWSGSTTHRNDHNRSLTLEQLIPYLPPNYEYFCLQKEIRDIDQKVLSNQDLIKNLGVTLDDFTDTVALCELMDIIISVDTSVAHLAGTLNKKTWLLLPFSPDWRWLLNRNDSPWYPSIKLYRQDKIGNWDNILEQLKIDLQKYSVPSLPNNSLL